MSTVVQMSQTVGPYQSGQVYRVRTRQAEVMVENSQATATGDTKTPDSGEGL